MKYLFLAIILVSVISCKDLGVKRASEAACLKGARGNTGLTGAIGPAGPAGQDGVQGPQGLPGEKGNNGLNGFNGANVVAKVSNANKSECKDGGVTVYLFTDLNNDNEYQETDSNLSTFSLCNLKEKNKDD